MPLSLFSSLRAFLEHDSNREVLCLQKCEGRHGLTFSGGVITIGGGPWRTLAIYKVYKLIGVSLLRVTLKEF